MSISTMQQQEQLGLCPNCNRQTLITFQAKQPHDKEFHDEYICRMADCDYCTFYMFDNSTIAKNQVTNPVVIDRLKDINSDLLLAKGNKIIQAQKQKQEVKTIILDSNQTQIAEVKPEVKAIIENTDIQVSKNPIIDWSPVIGYPEIKHIIDAAITTKSKKKIHLLIGGAPGTSKTVFLKTIEQSLLSHNANVHYLDATTLSSSGVIEYLFLHDVKFALIDELDKLIKEHQGVFLNLLESGVLQETKSKKIRKKDMKGTIFICTANYIDKIMTPLLTRLLVLNIPKYTKEQFHKIGIELLQKQYNKTHDMATYIVSNIWNIYTEIRREDPNLRQCVQVASLSNNDKSVIDPILKGITTYSKKYEE